MWDKRTRGLSDGLHCLFEDAQAVFHCGAHRSGEVIRLYVVDPHESAAPVAVGEDLHRRVVVCRRHGATDDGVGESARWVVESDEPFTRDGSVRESGDSDFGLFEFAVDHESRRHPNGPVSEVADNAPHVRRVRIDNDLFLHRGHFLLFSVEGALVASGNHVTRQLGQLLT